jgi:WD40 repeat protein/DNA-binding SARP family transcriptional activator
MAGRAFPPRRILLTRLEERRVTLEGTPAVGVDRPLRPHHVELLVLGPIEARRDGRRIDIGGPKQRLVLATLAASVGRRVSVERLIEAVWGETAQDGARRTIQTYVSNLRGQLGDVIRRQGDGYLLDVEREAIDALRFEDEVAAARTFLVAEPYLGAERLRHALAIWRGHPYADVDDMGDLTPEVARLEELRISALEARIEADLASGHHAELVPELEAIVAEHPLRESFRRQQMLALYRAGRQADALRVYHRTRDVLADELGIDPTPQLQDMERRILNQDADLDLGPRTELTAFLFADLEDSAPLRQIHPDRLGFSLPRFIEIVVGCVADNEGRVVRRIGERSVAAFPTVDAAVRAAEAAQLALAGTDWGDSPPLRARMAVDVGEVEVRGADISGPTMSRGDRIVSSGHGGQILLSADAHRALIDGPNGRWQVKALGDVSFRGLGRRQRVYQLVVDGLPSDFPELRPDHEGQPLSDGGFGRMIRGYELRERIGAGDFGVVYRAYQPSVGREVAVKCIRPEYGNQPAFIRRFETEARLVAGLEHPHIVALYDFWRGPEGAYLVMRWMRGGNLRTALARGPWNPGPALRLLDQIGSALTFAHRRGVVHRDIKPGNVLLDEDGNAYLSDFGIAMHGVDASESHRPLTSSPAYVAPEEVTGGVLSPGADVYALGLLTFELLTGFRPSPDRDLPSIHELRPLIPAPVDAVVRRAIADDPRERYQTVADLVGAAHAAMGDTEPPRAVDIDSSPVRNPYKGLRPFGEGDAADFHGRGEVVDRLVAAVAERPFVAVVGPSGIGKSSLVHAGLVPALRASPVTRDRLVADMYPGSHPFDELHAALLRIATTAPGNLMEELLGDERGLARATKRLLPAGTEMVLIVDQFEELYTLVRDDRLRSSFLAALVALVSDPRGRVSLVVTLRADLFDRPLRHPSFGELLGASTFPLAAPARTDLVEAIVLPSRQLGVRLEDGLVERIVHDVEGQPGALPLLQYALTELFAHRASDLLTVHGYEATGGVVGALGRRAEQLYEHLPPDRRDIARRVFLRLVSLGEGGVDTRRRTRRTELVGLGGARGVDDVLQRFGAHRLLTFDADPVSRTPTVEVAHEALIAAWPRLRDWLVDDRDGLRLHRSLTDAAAEWRRSGDDESLLLRGSRLERVAEWAARHDPDLNADERSFVEASTALVLREEGERTEAANREIQAARRVAEMERMRAEESATSTRRLRRRAAVLALALVVAAGAAGAALWQVGEAERNAALAREQQAAAVAARRDVERANTIGRAREYAAIALDRRESDPEGALLIGLQAVALSRSVDGSVLPEIESALRRLIQSSPIAGIVPDATGQGPDGTVGAVTLAWSPDGGLVASGGRDGVVAIWRTTDGTLERVWSARASEIVDTPGYGPWSNVSALMFSPDGRFVATGGGDGTVRLFDVETGSVVRQMDHTAPVWTLAFEPRSGSILVSGGEDGIARLWRSADGVPLAALDHRRDPDDPGIVGFVGFSPDGSRLVTWHGWERSFEPSTVRVWSVGGGRVVAERRLDGKPEGSAAISPDGTIVAVGGDDARIHLLDATDLSEVGRPLVGHMNTVTSLVFDSTGTHLVSQSTDETARLWDLATRQTVLILRREGEFAGLAVSPDARRIVTGELRDTGIALWDAIPGRELTAWGTPRGDRAQITGPPLTAVFGSGRLAIRRETGAETILEIWDPAILERPVSTTSIPIDPADLMWTALSPDGRWFASARADGGVGPPEVEVWDVSSGESVHVLDDPPAGVTFLEFAPDGSRLFGWSFDGTARVWDVASGERLWTWTPTTGVPINAAAVGSDGSWLVVGTARVENGGDVFLLDARTGQEVMRWLAPGDPRSVFAVAISPDGRWVAAGYRASGNVAIWDTRSRALRALVPTGHGDVYHVAFSPDGSRLATAGADGNERIWDLSTARPILRLTIRTASGTGSGSSAIAFAADGTRLYVGAKDGAVHAHLLDIDALIELAESRVTRRLTRDECRTHLHLEECPTAP